MSQGKRSVVSIVLRRHISQRGSHHLAEGAIADQMDPGGLQMLLQFLAQGHLVVGNARPGALGDGLDLGTRSSGMYDEVGEPRLQGSESFLSKIGLSTRHVDAKERQAWDWYHRRAMAPEPSHKPANTQACLSVSFMIY